MINHGIASYMVKRYGKGDARLRVSAWIACKRVAVAASLVARERCVLKKLSTGPSLSGVKSMQLSRPPRQQSLQGLGNGILTVSGSVAPRLPNVLVNDARPMQCYDMASGS